MSEIHSDTQTTIPLGATVIVDGRTYTVESFKGNSARAVSEDGKTAQWFDAREAITLGAGLWGLRGRIEPPAENPEASVVTQVAVSSVGATDLS